VETVKLREVFNMTSPRSPLPNYVNCYVCGHGNPRGFNVRFFVEGEVVVAQLETDATHMGYPDRVHGGIVAALLDETMGWAPAVEFGRFCVAVELNVRYLKPVPLNAPLLVRGQVTKADRRLWETTGEALSLEGTVYARGRGKYFPLSEEETDRVMAQLTLNGERLSLSEAIGRARGSSSG
jgi:uncharacterized protein (TIGR00369 family)